MSPQPDFAALRPLLEDARVQRAFALLNADGDEGRIVGGAVRNRLLGAPAADMDFATTATPQTVMARAAAAGLRTLPTGLAHGTVTLLVDGAAFETTTLREDVETDGRRAVVRFGRDFSADARRRDFTINALSLSADGRVHDYVEGLRDLRERRVRFIGDPMRRIEEDYLRILRFFRFSAAYAEGPLDAAGLRACVLRRDGLARLSAERARAEILKCLAARRAVEIAALMSECDLLRALGGIAYPARLAKGIAFESALEADGDPLRRLMFFAVRVEEDALRLRQTLRLSNAEFLRMTKAAHLSERICGQTPPDDPALAEWTMAFGAQALQDALALAFADRRAAPQDGAWREALHKAASYAELKLPVSGEELKKRGLSTGPAIGAALKLLQARWIRAGFPEEPECVMRLIDETLNSMKANEAYFKSDDQA